MAESTLTLDYTAIATALSRHLGWKAPASWDSQETADAAACIKDGLIRVYYPPPCPPDAKAHSWRFLRPTTTLIVWPDVAVDAAVTVTGVYTSTTAITATAATFYPSMVGRSIVITGIGTFTIIGYTSSTVITVSGDATCSAKTFSIASEGAFGLPDSFAGTEGPFLYPAGQGAYGPIEILNERQIANLQERSITTGRPRLGALRPRAFDATIGQRWDLLLYPTPNAVYTLNYQALIHPDTITSSLTQVMGGTPHSLLVKESVLLAGEEMLNRERTREAPFLRALRASIDFDRRSLGAATVGSLHDPSVGAEQFNRHAYDNFATYAGVQYPT